MIKENKAKKKSENTQIRKQKKKIINEKRKAHKNNELLNCPFDIEFNNLYGTCTCNGINKDNCARDI